MCTSIRVNAESDFQPAAEEYYLSSASLSSSRSAISPLSATSYSNHVGCEVGDVRWEPDLHRGIQL